MDPEELFVSPARPEESGQVYFYQVGKDIKELLELTVLDKVLGHLYHTDFTEFVKAGLRSLASPLPSVHSFSIFPFNSFAIRCIVVKVRLDHFDADNLL